MGARAEQGAVEMELRRAGVDLEADPKEKVAVASVDVGAQVEIAGIALKVAVVLPTASPRS